MDASDKQAGDCVLPAPVRVLQLPVWARIAQDYMHARSPIVVLDSGLGGLTVVAALRRRLPQEDIIYFGDTARLPYGSKSAATVSLFVREIIAYLQPLDPKHVVIACNTATALAMPAARAAFPHLPISGVIEPGARAAAAAAGAKPNPLIGVIATEATVRSRAYERAIARRRNYCRLMVRATPLLVPIIEEGRSETDPLVELALRQYLAPFVRYKVDVLVLGCTHYPLLRDRITAIMGPRTSVIDSAEMCAEDVAARLTRRGMLRELGTPGQLRCYVTDVSPRFSRTAGRFLGVQVDPPVIVPLDELSPVRNSAAAVRTAG